MRTNLAVAYLTTVIFLALYISRTAMLGPAIPSSQLKAAAAEAAAADFSGNKTVRNDKRETVAILEHSAVAGPGRTTGLETTDEVLESLVTAAPPLRGFQNKTGMLLAEKWMPEFESQRAEYLENFKSEALSGTVDFLKQPVSKLSGCAVYVNHDYKFFWIRALKTGSSSVAAGLGNLCKKTRKPGSDCGTTFQWGMLKSEPGDAERWWKEYFVFSIVRNPYSRFTSAFFYLNPAHACSNQTFGEACTDPFLRRLERNSSSQCKLDEFYFRHIREQTPCLFTQEGGLAVDFIAQTENLAEDFKQVVQEINKRRRAGLSPMRNTLGEYRKRNSWKSLTATYANVFRQYPYCLDNLDKLLSNEFKDLGYV